MTKGWSACVRVSPQLPAAWLDRAGLDRLTQRDERLPRRHELVRDVAAEIRVRDRACDSMPVELLRVVELVPPRHSTGMKVPDVGSVRANRADHVTFHDLHVINVVQQLHAR